MYKNVKWKNISRFARIMFKYKKQHAGAIIFTLLNVLLTLLLPYLTMKIIDDGIKSGSIKLLFKLILFYLAVTLLQNACKLLSDYIYSVIGKKTIFMLRYKIIRHLQKLSGEYYSNARAGELMTRLQNDVANVEEVATKMFFSMMSDLLVSIGMFIFLFKLQFDLVIVSIVLQPLLILIQNKINKKMGQITFEMRNSLGELTSVIIEYLSSMMHFIVLNAKKYFYKRYIPSEKRFLKQNIRLEMLSSLNVAGTSIISALITTGILGYGGYKVILGTMTIGALIAFNLYSQRLLAPIIRIVQMNLRFQQAFVSINRIFEILDEPITITHDNGGYKSQKIEGHIEFRNVGFAYDNNGSLFEGINLEFLPGKITALVGVSGAGKTTITNLLMRLWDIKEGELLLDGVSIRDYNLNFLRKNIAIVSQDSFLYNDTIYNNLVLSMSNVSMDEVIRVTKEVGIYDFIMTLPDKFDTIVGEKGIKMSGGQKQRISIARAMLKNTPIVILDEATSSLDNISEKIIQDNITDFFAGKTVIIIAHRLSTIESADLIYVINYGNVVEKGKHLELLKLGGIYHQLYTKNIS